MGWEHTMAWLATWTRFCVLVVLSASMGCVSNPTPHPGQTDASQPTGADPTRGAGGGTEGDEDPSLPGPPNGAAFDDSGDAAALDAVVDGGTDDVGTDDVAGPVVEDGGSP